jgi:hypothetical protein
MKFEGFFMNEWFNYFVLSDIQHLCVHHTRCDIHLIDIHHLCVHHTRHGIPLHSSSAKRLLHVPTPKRPGFPVYLPVAYALLSVPHALLSVPLSLPSSGALPLRPLPFRFFCKYVLKIIFINSNSFFDI